MVVIDDDHVEPEARATLEGLRRAVAPQSTSVSDQPRAIGATSFCTAGMLGP